MWSAESDLADSALHAPQAGFGDNEFDPDIFDKAQKAHQEEDSTPDQARCQSLVLPHPRLLS
jgi:hypothetical protein